MITKMFVSFLGFGQTLFFFFSMKYKEKRERERENIKQKSEKRNEKKIH